MKYICSLLLLFGCKSFEIAERTITHDVREKIDEVRDDVEDKEREVITVVRSLRLRTQETEDSLRAVRKDINKLEKLYRKIEREYFLLKDRVRSLKEQKYRIDNDGF